MKYDIKSLPNDDACLMVEEPAVAAYAVGRATAKPWVDTDCDWDKIDRNLPDHLTVNTPEALYGKLMEGMEAIREGRIRPMDDVVNDILRDIEIGTI